MWINLLFTDDMTQYENEFAFLGPVTVFDLKCFTYGLTYLLGNLNRVYLKEIDHFLI